MVRGAAPARGSRVGRLLAIPAGLALAVAANLVAGQLVGAQTLDGGAPTPTASASAAPSAAPPAEAPEANARPLPVASYTLQAHLDTGARELRGEGTITWTNRSRTPQKELYFHLYLNAFKNDATLFARTSLHRPPDGAWGFIDVTRLVDRATGTDLWPAREPTSPGDAADETDIRVPLPREVAPGETLELDVAWLSRLPGLTSRTGFAGSFFMVAQWFPKLARLEPDGRWAHFPFHGLSEFYADFGRYDVTLDAPAGFTVGATGVRKEERESADRVIHHFVQDDVHDFAFTAWDGCERRAVDSEGVEIEILFPRDLEEVATRELRAASFGLAHMSKLFGPYPYEKLTIVHTPVAGNAAGGMEYPTLITTRGQWFTPLLGSRSLELVTLHELAHQWFYGVVASNENAHPFLDEGLASYAEAITAGAFLGRGSLYEGLGLHISDQAFHRVGATTVAGEAPIAASASEFTSQRDYGALVYYRASTLLSTFARVWGEEPVNRALGLYARRHRFAHPGPEDLIAALREVLGEEPAATFRAALFERGTVDYLVETVERVRSGPHEGVFGDPKAPGAAPPEEKDDGNTIVVRRLGSLVFPVDVEVWLASGKKHRVRWDARQYVGRISVRAATRITAVVIDPDHTVLLDPNLGNNAWSPNPGSFAPRVFERASLVGGALAGVVLP
jgi:hypothetical protein